jgi:drug/metabolite transporter (DMT)-like permease
MVKSVTKSGSPSAIQLILAFAILYIVWGSTYFFIQRAIESFPPFMLGALRFFAASFLMLLWCLYKREPIFNASQVKTAVISGLLLLFIGNGAVIWVERYMPSSVVAIAISSSPIWFVLLDKPNWAENLNNKYTVLGLMMGFAGVILLFYKSIKTSLNGGENLEVGGLALITLASISWAGGSLYSKYKSSGGAAIVSSTWQMFGASVAFGILSLSMGEPDNFYFSTVSTEAWLSIIYLILFGSIAGFSAYVWLLSVRPATQVSTHAYVNPVVAVLLGVFFAGEKISMLQIVGLAVILVSVLMINLAKYRQE